MNELALFAGAGGGILAGELLGWRCVCAVEVEPYPASVLAQRQNDGLLPPFPIWDDVCTFDGRPWRGIAEVISGGFPCQDISVAGKGAGIEGERSGLWGEFARIIGEVRPRYAFIENSPMLTLRGLDRVLCDLAALGYDARWGVVSAADVGAPHKRERVWIVANANELTDGQQYVDATKGRNNHEPNNGMAYAHVPRIQTRMAGQEQQQKRNSGIAHNESHDSGGEKIRREMEWWATEPNVGRVVNGMAARVERLKAIGNGQVPQCAAEAWRLLTNH